MKLPLDTIRHSTEQHRQVIMIFVGQIVIYDIYLNCRDEIIDQKPSVMGTQKASIETSTTV